MFSNDITPREWRSLEAWLDDNQDWFDCVATPRDFIFAAWEGILSLLGTPVSWGDLFSLWGN